MTAIMSNFVRLKCIKNAFITNYYNDCNALKTVHMDIFLDLVVGHIQILRYIKRKHTSTLGFEWVFIIKNYDEKIFKLSDVPVECSVQMHHSSLFAECITNLIWMFPLILEKVKV